ncbi:MAG: DNA primase [Deltaproteobacteria bacterium]
MVNFNNDGVVKEIKRRLSILDLIENYTSIKKVGKGYVGLCPFHDDHNPSMHVDEEKGFFHCFSCGAGGDILAFYMRYNSITFPEAVSELAKRANIKVEKPTVGPKRKSQAGALLKINSVVSGFYKRVLLKSGKAGAARDYLKSRKIPSETIEEFNLGYAPEGWDHLVKYLQKHNIPLTLAEKTGLVVKKNNGEGYYDRFRDRIMFPIGNVEGRVIGFGGRTVEGEGDQPKYINSPESEIYHKRRNFYGLDKSRDHIRKNNRAIIVEGYTDFLSLYSAGIKNAVATLGTALTRDHVVILRRYTDRFVVVFDGDESGTKAAVRSLDIFLEEGLLPNVVLLPGGKDPDSFLSEDGGDEFIRLVENSPSLLDFYIENTIRECRNGNMSLKSGVGEIAAILMMVNDPLLKSSYIKKTAERLGLRENEVSSLIKRKKAPGGIGDARAVSAANNHERLLLTILLKFPQLSSIIAGYDWHGLISNVEVKSVLDEIVEKGVHDPSSLLQNFQGNPAQSLISEALFSSSGISDEKTAGKMIDSCIGKLKLLKLEEGLKGLRLKMDEAVKNKDSLLEKELLKEYSDLMKQKNRKKGEPNGKE